jgi:hypothetical protein
VDAALWAEIRRLHLREGWRKRRIARHLPATITTDLSAAHVVARAMTVS